jgi:membrane associated rhomboid family serine protease
MSVTLIYSIIIITCIVSIYCFSNTNTMNKLMLSPYDVVHDKQVYRVISHLFIHADWMHLIFNMYVLYMFGEAIEQVFTSDVAMYYFFPEIPFWGVQKGYFHLIVLYFGGGLAASASGIIKYKDNPSYSSLGASGAVSAVVFSYMLLFPTQELTIIFLPFIPLPAFVFGILFLAYEYFMDKFSKRSRVAHDAHFWGAIFGVVYTIVISPKFLSYFLERVHSIFN